MHLIGFLAKRPWVAAKLDAALGFDGQQFAIAETPKRLRNTEAAVVEALAKVLVESQLCLWLRL